MAGVWLRSALTAYADIFPTDAPKPTVESLAAVLSRGPSLVAVDGATVVGLVQGNGGWVSHLYVDPDRWRTGIGVQLHDAAIARIRGEGHATARLWVLRDNALARAMYERRGWKLTAVERAVYAPAGIFDVNYRLDL
jgi:GNAT superfamily N-acetyltransferase